MCPILAEKKIIIQIDIRADLFGRVLNGTYVLNIEGFGGEGNVAVVHFFKFRDHTSVTLLSNVEIRLARKTNKKNDLMRTILKV